MSIPVIMVIFSEFGAIKPNEISARTNAQTRDIENRIITAIAGVNPRESLDPIWCLGINVTAQELNFINRVCHT